MKRSASRRDVLRTAAASAAFSLLLGPVERALAASQGLEFGPAEPFSFDALVARARDRARSSYRPPYRPAPEIVPNNDYDAHGKTRFPTTHALLPTGPGAPP